MYILLSRHCVFNSMDLILMEILFGFIVKPLCILNQIARLALFGGHGSRLIIEFRECIEWGNVSGNHDKKHTHKTSKLHDWTPFD